MRWAGDMVGQRVNNHIVSCAGPGIERHTPGCRAINVAIRSRAWYGHDLPQLQTTGPKEYSQRHCR